MSHYTKNELSIIEEATSAASRYVNIAHSLLSGFIESYFEKADDSEHLITELKYRPEMIESQLDAVLHILSDGKRELDVFSSPDELKYFFETVEEKKKIVETVKNEKNI